MAQRPDREVLLEFTRIGRAVKVTAVDPVTLTEISIQGPAAADRSALTRVALAKLDHVLNRDKRSGK